MSESEPVIDPLIVTARNGNKGIGLVNDPPNKPTILTVPPLRTQPFAKLREPSAPTKSMAAGTPPFVSARSCFTDAGSLVL